MRSSGKVPLPGDTDETLGTEGAYGRTLGASDPSESWLHVLLDIAVGHGNGY